MRADMNAPVLKNFASPLSCFYLKEAGLDVKTSYFWKYNGMSALLCTNYFDIDGIYEQAYANVESIYDPPKRIPAFEIVELQSILPDYTMCRGEGMYCLSIPGMQLVQDARLPDVFAAAVIKYLRMGLITKERAAERMLT